jgi:hypothetical protein
MPMVSSMVLKEDRKHGPAAALTIQLGAGHEAYGGKLLAPVEI